MAQINPEIQRKIQEFQELQQQSRVILAQKYQTELQLRETQNASEELEKTHETEVHKVVGQILIKSDKENLKKELKEKIEALELRLKAIENQEKKLQEKSKILQETLKKGFEALDGVKGGAS